MLGKGVDFREYRRMMIRTMKRMVTDEQADIIITAALDNIEIGKEKE